MTVKETTITEGHVSEKLETRDLVLIAQCAAMMTVCSWISVPAAVPFTMQTFGVFMAIGLLGGKRGTAAVAVYLLLGAAGLPVFSGFTCERVLCTGWARDYWEKEDHVCPEYLSHICSC